MVLWSYFQSDGRRMANLPMLTRTPGFKIVTFVFLLISLLNYSESFPDASGRDEDTWRSEAHYGQSIVPNLPSSGRLGIESAKRHFIRSDTNPRRSQLSGGFIEFEHSPSSALSFIQGSSKLLQRRSLAAISPTPAPVAPAPLSPPAEVDGFVCGICGEFYTAGIGETVSSVAVYCNVVLDQLLTLNPGLSTSSNITRRQINIPCPGMSSINCSRCGHDAVIKSGNTLDLLARGCNLTLKMLEIANPNIDYSNIFPGQYITLPCADGKIVENVTGCGVCGRGLTVERDGLIDEIASRCKVSANQLLEANPAVNTTGSVIQGQFLRVPCSGNDPSNCGPCGNSFTTVKGDSLMVIAAKCRVGYIELTEKNPGVDLTQGDENLQVSIPCNSIPAPVVCSPCNPNFFSTASIEISLIAATCKVSPESIAYANDLPFTGAVPAGRNLSIPCVDLPQRNLRNCGNCGSSFTLASQVTLEAIAGACGTTVAAIRTENGNFTFDLLGPMDEIAIPCNMPQVNCGPCGIGYKTEVFDSLESVAVKCATPVAQIVRANPQYNFSRPLLEDQSLHMPCASQGPSSWSEQLPRPLGCSNQLLHVLIVMIVLNIKFNWCFL